MSSPMPKMSSVVQRISPELARSLPWDALLQLFEVRKGLNELERVLGFPRGTVSKAQRIYPTDQHERSLRGLSAKAHQAILKRIATKFSTSAEMQVWMKLNWPSQLLEQTQGTLHDLYEVVDRNSQIPPWGIFPMDYIELDEEAELVDLLVQNKEVQVLWITGLPGSGKSTLAASLAGRDWKKIGNPYEKILWVDAEQGSYAEGLRQIAYQLDLSENSTVTIEQKLQGLIRRNKILIILDGLHEVEGLSAWRGLAGYLGRLVVTSRIRLAKNLLEADRHLRQWVLGGFTPTQCRQFLARYNQDSDLSALDFIIRYTGGLPLALRLLMGPMLDLNISPAKLQEQLEKYQLNVLQYPPGMEQRNTNLRLCFEVSFRILLERFPDSALYFRSAGVFATRTISQALLRRAAGISESLADIQVVATLQRYNFLDTLVIQGEHFVKMHVLLHEYAREELERSNQQTFVKERYREAVYAWAMNIHLDFANGEYSAALKWHAPDILAVLEELIGKAAWGRALDLMNKLFQFLLTEGQSSAMPQIISEIDSRLPQDIPVARLVKLTLHNYLGTLAMVEHKLSLALEQYELVQQLGEGLPLEPVWTDQYWREMGSAILGKARCWLYNDQVQEALNYLSSTYPTYVFSINSGDDIQMEKALLLAELFDEAGQFELALDRFEAGLELCKKISNPIKTNAVLGLQANCYRRMGNLTQAIEILSLLFAKERQPDGLLAEIGLDLAGVLAETQQYSPAEAVLDQVEMLLQDYEETNSYNADFARLWKYRAEIRRTLNDYLEAIQCAKRSLNYWRRIPDVSDEQKKMRELIEIMEEELSKNS